MTTPQFIKMVRIFNEQIFLNQTFTRNLLIKKFSDRHPLENKPISTANKVVLTLKECGVIKDTGHIERSSNLSGRPSRVYQKVYDISEKSFELNYRKRYYKPLKDRKPVEVKAVPIKEMFPEVESVMISIKAKDFEKMKNVMLQIESELKSYKQENRELIDENQELKQKLKEMVRKIETSGKEKVEDMQWLHELATRVNEKRI